MRKESFSNYPLITQKLQSNNNNNLPTYTTSSLLRNKLYRSITMLSHLGSDLQILPARQIPFFAAHSFKNHHHQALSVQQFSQNQASPAGAMFGINSCLANNQSPTDTNLIIKTQTFMQNSERLGAAQSNLCSSNSANLKPLSGNWSNNSNTNTNNTNNCQTKNKKGNFYLQNTHNKEQFLSHFDYLMKTQKEGQSYKSQQNQLNQQALQMPYLQFNSQQQDFKTSQAPKMLSAQFSEFQSYQKNIRSKEGLEKLREKAKVEVLKKREQKQKIANEIQKNIQQSSSKSTSNDDNVQSSLQQNSNFNQIEEVPTLNQNCMINLKEQITSYKSISPVAQLNHSIEDNHQMPHYLLQHISPRILQREKSLNLKNNKEIRGCSASSQQDLPHVQVQQDVEMKECKSEQRIHSLHQSDVSQQQIKEREVEIQSLDNDSIAENHLLKNQAAFKLKAIIQASASNPLTNKKYINPQNHPKFYLQDSDNNIKREEIYIEDDIQVNISTHESTKKPQSKIQGNVLRERTRFTQKSKTQESSPSDYLEKFYFCKQDKRGQKVEEVVDENCNVGNLLYSESNPIKKRWEIEEAKLGEKEESVKSSQNRLLMHKYARIIHRQLNHIDAIPQSKAKPKFKDNLFILDQTLADKYTNNSSLHQIPRVEPICLNAQQSVRTSQKELQYTNSPVDYLRKFTEYSRACCDQEVFSEIIGEVEDKKDINLSRNSSNCESNNVSKNEDNEDEFDLSPMKNKHEILQLFLADQENNKKKDHIQEERQIYNQSNNLIQELMNCNYELNQIQSEILTSVDEHATGYSKLLPILAFLQDSLRQIENKNEDIHPNIKTLTSLMERLAILEDRNASELLILAQSGYQISLWKLGILKRIKKHVQNNFHMMNSS